MTTARALLLCGLASLPVAAAFGWRASRQQRRPKVRPGWVMAACFALTFGAGLTAALMPAIDRAGIAGMFLLLALPPLMLVMTAALVVLLVPFARAIFDRLRSGRAGAASPPANVD